MTPRYRILADSNDITAAVQERLLSLRTIDEAGEQSDSLELRLDDSDHVLALPRTGASLELALGWESEGLQTIGRYTVDEIGHEGPPSSLIIVAKAADMRASLKAQKTRSFAGKTLQDVVETVAADHGLQARVSPSLAGIRLNQIDQTEESDLNLLTRLARQHDAIAKPAFGFFVLAPRGEARTVTGQVMPRSVLTAKQLTSWRMRAADRGRYAAVKANWHDEKAAQRRTEKAGDGNPAYTIRYTFPDQAQAQRAVVAKQSALARGKATISVTTLGRTDLVAEGQLTLQGIRSGVDGTWSITRVEQTLDSSGWITRIEGEVPKG